jgi:hypothetical protein
VRLGEERLRPRGVLRDALPALEQLCKLHHPPEMPAIHRCSRSLQSPREVGRKAFHPIAVKLAQREERVFNAPFGGQSAQPGRLCHIQRDVLAVMVHVPEVEHPRGAG